MDFWESCLSKLRDVFSERQFQIFISRMSLSINNETLTLTMPSSSGVRWVRRNEAVERTLTEQARSLLGMNNPSVVVAEAQRQEATQEPANGGEVSAKVPAGEVARPPRAAAAKPADSGGLNPLYTFDTFISGTSNQLAMAAGCQIAGGIDIRHNNPLLIWGNVGLGKTHLAQAIGNQYKRQNPARQVRYITSNEYVNEVVNAFRNNQAEDFRCRFGSLDMLIIDDIQFLGGDKKRTREELFLLFNSLVGDSGKPLILTCDRLPNKIKEVHLRLTTRFQSGLMVSIAPPELELRIGILQHKAEEMQVRLAQNVAKYIAEKLKSNVRELEGALRRVVAFANFNNLVEITIPACREALADLLGSMPTAVTPDLIQKAVADYYQVRPSDLKSVRRTRAITRPRHIAIYLTRQITDMSLPEIGQAFGGRNHTSVIHACRKIENELQANPEFNQEVLSLQHMIAS